MTIVAERTELSSGEHFLESVAVDAERTTQHYSYGLHTSHSFPQNFSLVVPILVSHLTLTVAGLPEPEYAHINGGHVLRTWTRWPENWRWFAGDYGAGEHLEAEWNEYADIPSYRFWSIMLHGAAETYIWRQDALDDLNPTGAYHESRTLWPDNPVPGGSVIQVAGIGAPGNRL